MNKILIVDDESNVLAAFQEMLADEGYRVLTATRAESALARMEQESPDLVILDIRMPGMNGLDALSALKQGHLKTPVIVMTGQGTMETAIEATKRGAFDYLLKPFDPELMLQTIGRALEGVRLMKRQVSLAPEILMPAADAMVGQSASMQEVFKAIGRVAATDASVLIRGESGTGKELTARAIYQHSKRADAPLLVLNCTSIPESLLESELFGHERGAFTGAAARRIGKFEQAHGGTLLLDEIGDISGSVQAKILRVLQEKTFQRVGGNDLLHADVRLLAATNRNLEEAMRTGRFREDLYHRLNVVTVHLPPLRERREDIVALIDYFVGRFSAELGIERPIVSDEAMCRLCDHSWPGNVRELEHCIHRTLIFTHGHPINEQDVRLERPEQEMARDNASLLDGSSLNELLREYLDTYQGASPFADFLETAERLLLQEALRRSQGNQSQAAKLLGLARPTLHAKLQKLSLRRDENPAA